MPRRSLIVTAILSLSAGQALAASPYSAIYSFGDSLSDAGNLYLADGGTEPVSPPYSLGRFSNGNVWVQDLSLALGLGPLTASLLGGNDYAIGGAQTGTTDLHTATPIDLPYQIEAFESTHVSAPSTALYTISIGANDIFGALEALVATNPISLTEAEKVVGEAAANTATAADDLFGLGARDLVLFGVPNLGLTPAYNTTSLSGYASEFARLFNADVSADLAPVEAGGLTVYDLDTYDFTTYVVDHPSQFGFTNVTDPCWTGNFTSASSGSVCAPTEAEQDQYLFWDDVHPTAAGHQLVADQALAALGIAVPEPSTWAMMILGLAGLGAAAVRKTRETAARG